MFLGLKFSKKGVRMRNIRTLTIKYGDVLDLTGWSIETGCVFGCCSRLSTSKQISANNTVDARNAFAYASARKAA